ncbi:Uncharacterised protein [Starkeya nomas]|uniref:Uncharacterized protein n=1 Tax=Starkeya nomas TaxID=2666134 RepID=A0A5S9R6K3_9HYPH|nr:hypothetical protein [Starkeya nomas]CAA0129792.1 Uncharacterised protein [Starkeya nomas]
MKSRRDLPAFARTVAPNGQEHYLVNGSAAGVHLYAERRQLAEPIVGRSELTTDVVAITIPYSEFAEVSWEELGEIADGEASI